MDTIESETCIRFRYRTHQHDFVNIYSGRYCKSNLGRTGGMQEISLNRKTCMEKGIIMHELLHALGYIHMHSRPDRDKYVKIQWNNIQPKWFSEFNRVNPNIFMHLGTPYDYQSIMHYGSTAFTKNGGHTIVPKNEAYLNVIGQRGGLSEGDIKRINNRYKCKVERAYPQLLNHISSYSSSSSEYLPKPLEYSFRSSKESDGFVPVAKPSYSFRHLKDSDEVDDLFNL
jgi:Astacin (Peptidase family M12A)